VVSNALQIHRRGFLKTASVALFWSAVFGGIFGTLAYFRVTRGQSEGDAPWHVAARLWLERLELQTYDWRARELGASSARTDGVVAISIDDETVQNAKESEHPEWAMQPWPRNLSGSLVEQAGREGAAVVVFGPAVDAVSAHHCAGPRAEAVKPDDALFAQRLLRAQTKVVLPFDWSSERPRPPDRALMPFLGKAGEFRADGELHGRVQEILATRAPVWVIAKDDVRTVWVGAPTEARARELAARFEPRQPPVLRGLSPADAEYEVGAQWLVARLAAVTVAGLDVEGLPLARTLEAPVPELLLAAAHPSTASASADVDGKVRGVRLLTRTKGTDKSWLVLPSVPLEALMQAEGTRALRYEGGRLRIGARLAIPMQADGFLHLRFGADSAEHDGRNLLRRVIPAWRLLVNAQDDVEGRGLRHHDNELQGRLAVFTDERDEGGKTLRTPVGRVSRAMLFAQAIANLRAGDGIVRVPPIVDLSITLGYALLGGALALAWSLTVRRPGWLAWAATLGLVAVVHGLAARQMYVEQQRWIAMAAPLLACSLSFLAALGYARTLEQGFRDFMLRTLGGAVRADVVRRVERNLLLMRPERREVTVYVGDLEGFTSVVAERDPKIVGEVLQEYLSEMTDLALDRRGHVDKYLGDGLMVFWGAPIELPEHAAQACETALVLRAHFEKRRADWERRCGRPLALHAGLDTGLTVVGEMGTHHRVNYTVLGDPVTSAFRLDTFAKRFDLPVLVTERVRAQVGELFLFRSVDRLLLGRPAVPVDLHELVGRASSAAEASPRLTRHEEALQAYRAQRFEDARAIWRELHAEHAEVLLKIYLDRCDLFILRPPGEGWNGVADRRA
jgi:adenylate cyclase